MNQNLLLLLIPFIGGIASLLQARFMGVMDRQIGTLESVFITYGLGGLMIGLVMVFTRGGNLSEWQSVPWYTLLAGLMGLIIVGTLGYSVNRTGLVITFTVFLITQYALGAAADHYGFLTPDVRPMNLMKTIGMILMLVGGWFVIRF